MNTNIFDLLLVDFKLLRHLLLKRENYGLLSDINLETFKSSNLKKSILNHYHSSYIGTTYFR